MIKKMKLKISRHHAGWNTLRFFYKVTIKTIKYTKKYREIVVWDLRFSRQWKFWWCSFGLIRRIDPHGDLIGKSIIRRENIVHQCQYVNWRFAKTAINNWETSLNPSKTKCEQNAKSWDVSHLNGHLQPTIEYFYVYLFLLHWKQQAAITHGNFLSTSHNNPTFIMADFGNIQGYYFASTEIRQGRTTENFSRLPVHWLNLKRARPKYCFSQTVQPTYENAEVKICNYDRFWRPAEAKNVKRNYISAC
jgi:hypothetical protein